MHSKVDSMLNFIIRKINLFEERKWILVGRRREGTLKPLIDYFNNMCKLWQESICG